MPEDALLTLRLPSRPEAAAAARTALAALNGDLHLISAPRLADAQLLLSELVTNAVRDGDGDAVELRVRATELTLRVEVANRGAVFDPSRLPPRAPGGVGGWGLRIVDVVAHRWGVSAKDGGVRVWFEVDRPQAQTDIQLTGEASPPAEPASG